MRRRHAARERAGVTALWLLPLALLAMAGGCREGAAPYGSVDRPDASAGASWRLTYAPGDDRAPTWSPGGDTIYYSAERPGPIPRVAALSAVPREGGAARPLLETVQGGSAAGRWLLAPALSPDGRHVAYTERWEHRLRDLCLPRGTDGTRTDCSPREWEPLTAILTEIRIRVRARAAVGPIEQDPTLSVPLDHYDLDRSRRPYHLEGTHVYRDHPFHLLSRTESIPFHRPSWGPEGRRLAFSDGLGLRVWEVGDTAAPRIPGTEDGISASWSPDGEWIAFTRLERGDSLKTACLQSVWEAASETWVETCLIEQVRWPIVSRTISLARPDGSESMELGEGEQPAWGPLSRFLYFRREGRLWRMEPVGAEPEVLEGTEDGHEPSVSPDGKYLAFVRRSDFGPGDIWILDLLRAS